MSDQGDPMTDHQPDPAERLTLNVGAPHAGEFRILGKEGRVLLRITADGTVVGDATDAGEAAEVFVREVLRHAPARTADADARLAAVGETREALSQYLAKMDRAGGGVYTPDFRGGFRHALAMLDAYQSEEDPAEGRARPETREAARLVLDRMAAALLAEQHALSATAPEVGQRKAGEVSFDWPHDDESHAARMLRIQAEYERGEAADAGEST